jgi:N-acetylmuramoyl-L-alanine amidase
VKRALVVVGLLLAFASVAQAQVKVVIDPGHGGTDPGGVGTGLQEKNVVLDVSKRFKALLDKDTADTGGGGTWTTYLTRSDDTFVSLAGRSAYSNNRDADRFMSIHSNAFGDPSANGTETFSLTNSGNGAALRNLVQAEMIAAWKLTNRGNKTANFAVLRETAAPAVLHELAFITNATDAAKLASATERQKAAVAHLRALQRHYNLAPYVPGDPAPPMTGTIAGHVFSATGPVIGANVTLGDGAPLATAGDGEFTFADVPAGTHSLVVTASGFEGRTVEVTVVAGETAAAEIELVATDGRENPETGETTTLGGCATTGDASWLLVLGVLLVVRRRRRQRH